MTFNVVTMKFLHYNLLLTVLISALFLLSGCRDELVDDSFDNKEPEVSTSMEAPCINGMAAGFPCNNYDLISHKK